MSESLSPSRTGAAIPMAVAAFLFVALVTMSVASYGALPEKIPVHFSLSGVPDGWSEKVIGAWFLPIVAVVMNLIFWGCAWIVRNKPTWVNVPRRAEFVALSPEARAPVTAMLTHFLAWIAALVEGLFIFIQAGMFAVAMGTWTLLPGWPFIGFIGVFVVYIVVMYVRIARAIRRATTVSTPS
ncbi:MAG: DUF1648 domain-containing protein [Deltaproteobacteria bacterium]|nr:DUF1648 domain-containing protein [Deltaproteobacteria bacterium]